MNAQWDSIVVYSKICWLNNFGLCPLYSVLYFKLWTLLMRNSGYVLLIRYAVIHDAVMKVTARKFQIPVAASLVFWNTFLLCLS